MRLRHKKWTDSVLSNNKDISSNLDELDIEKISLANSIEIGCGLGGFLFSLVCENRNVFYLGVEVNRNAFASCVKKFSTIKEKLHNFYIVNAGVEKLFEKFKDKQFNNIYINFPDPWPRKKEHKRRLTYTDKLIEYHRILADDGKLFFRSDNKDLFNNSVEYFNNSKLFDIKIISPFFYEKENIIPTTEYEQKFRNLGIEINLLIAKKK